MNIEVSPGKSKGGECAGCFAKIAASQGVINLLIKKVKLIVVSTEKREELCLPCSMELLDQLGRAIQQAR